MNLILSSCLMPICYARCLSFGLVLDLLAERHGANRTTRQIRDVAADYWVQSLIHSHQKLRNFQQTTLSIVQRRRVVRHAKLNVAFWKEDGTESVKKNKGELLCHHTTAGEHCHRKISP